MSESAAQLTESLLKLLQNETFVLINTVDAESGGPTSTVISWVYAVDSSTLRLAIDHRSRLVRNMKENSLVTLTVFGEETVHAINGSAVVKIDPLPDVPFEVCCFDVQISAVRNALFYGAQLESAPKYAKAYDQRAAEKLDGQVFAAMQKA
ncbi:pyridoxamine 5'-phosphate oxidase family protein [Paenibacillus zanthoxyli]|uniref:pyridoxamine 5'-phosphate oxidase family protein n=1 Tax=Paenibacillus zanthoxyli TaxID=369399 RepID=UPI0004722F84|nr:pyridoxamine 5'-phosphate oxidase family protein [Paenibacillus zanthoxyli]